MGKNTSVPLERQGMRAVENRVRFFAISGLVVTMFQKFPNYNYNLGANGKSNRMQANAGANRITFQMCTVKSVVSGAILRLCHQCHAGP